MPSPNWELKQLKTIRDARGSLISVHENTDIFPHPISRIYYLFDISSNAARGGHAHKALFQALFALSGAFKVHLDDGSTSETIDMRSPDQALIIRPGTWRSITDFTYGSVCLCCASLPFDEADYIRDHDEFIMHIS